MPEDQIMTNEICICCAEKMTTASPRNPNICLSCEQLLEDDCSELEKLLGGLAPAATRFPAEFADRPMVVRTGSGHPH